MKKNFNKPLKLLFILVILLLIIGGAEYYLNIRKMPKYSYMIQDYKENYPIYPGATFIKKEETQACSRLSPEEVELAKVFFKCNTIVYKYKTLEKFEKVLNWYSNDESNSGWTLSGGAGDADTPERYGHFASGSKSYWIYIGTTIEGSKIITIFEVRIPKQ